MTSLRYAITRNAEARAPSRMGLSCFVIYARGAVRAQRYCRWRSVSIRYAMRDIRTKSAKSAQHDASAAPPYATVSRQHTEIKGVSRREEQDIRAARCPRVIYTVRRATRERQRACRRAERARDKRSEKVREARAQRGMAMAQVLRASRRGGCGEAACRAQRGEE